MLAKNPPTFLREILLQKYYSYWERSNSRSLEWKWEDQKDYLDTLVYVAGEITEREDKELTEILLYEFNDPLRNWIGQTAGRGLLKVLQKGTSELHDFIRSSIIKNKHKYESKKSFSDDDTTQEMIKKVIEEYHDSLQ